MKFSKKEEYLKQKDQKLRKLIDTNGHISFKPEKKYQFDILVGIVISQFISTKAANSIFQNIKKNFNTDYLNHDQFKNLNIDEIKKLGLSMNKARTIKELSNLFQNKTLKNLDQLSDQKLNEALLSVFGIGPWSINMFEIFCLGKFNIFSPKDAGLRLAMNKLGMVVENSEFQAYKKYADRWSPYKTIASLHLWKLVD